jgi:CheY-like chemotaxis protein
MFSKLMSRFDKPRDPQKHIKVLVIDDTEVDRRLACAAIERGGYTALNAVDGYSGIELAKQEKPNMIILDYNLPDLKGPEVSDLLKTHNETKNIPILFLTSLNAPDNVIDCFETGENYLTKPISIKMLLKNIDDILLHFPSK